jgi:hypothetical protein
MRPIYYIREFIRKLRNGPFNGAVGTVTKEPRVLTQMILADSYSADDFGTLYSLEVKVGKSIVVAYYTGQQELKIGDIVRLQTTGDVWSYWIPSYSLIASK